MADDNIPFMFIRDEEKEFRDVYLKLAKKFRLLIRAIDHTLGKLGDVKTIRPASLENLEKKIRKLEILLLMNEKKVMEALTDEDDKTRKLLVRAFNSLARDLIAIEQKIDRKIGKMGEAELQEIRNVLEKDLERLEAKSAAHAEKLDRISGRLEALTEMVDVVFRKRMEDYYLVSDRDLIRTLLRIRENVRKGKWRGLPEWAKEMRKEILEDIGLRIVMAAEVAIVKQLVKSPATQADLLKKVPVSRYTLQKALKSLEERGHVRKERRGRSVYYALI